jgi:hypothetical protein
MDYEPEIYYLVEHLAKCVSPELEYFLLEIRKLIEFTISKLE